MARHALKKTALANSLDRCKVPKIFYVSSIIQLTSSEMKKVSTFIAKAGNTVMQKVCDNRGMRVYTSPCCITVSLRL